MTTSQPPTKRLKSNHHHSLDFHKFNNIKSILPNELLASIPLENVLIGTLVDNKRTSELILLLGQRLPLPTLQHLKRVKQTKILLCSIQEIINEINNQQSSLTFYHQLNTNLRSIHSYNSDDDSSIAKCKQYFIDHLQCEIYNEHIVNYILSNYLTFKGIEKNIVNYLCNQIEMGKVAAVQPKLRWQYDDATKRWPCKFHENKYLEKLFNYNVFNENEKTFHSTIMNVCLFLTNQTTVSNDNNDCIDVMYCGGRRAEGGSDDDNGSGKGEGCCGIAIDPRNNHIVAIGIVRCDLHPLMHCSMVLIDMVARSQNGGSWDGLINFDNTNCENDNKSLFNYDGVNGKTKQLILKHFDNIKFGAQIVLEKSEMASMVSSDLTGIDNLSKYGPYLCTGYDVYLTYEPCIMCAMALVHSRVRRIFYNRPTKNGALNTIAKLHTIKALNHHYEVYQIN